jgi:hypothetical protein
VLDDIERRYSVDVNEILPDLAEIADEAGRLPDDGKSITFPSADVTAFVIEYLPRPDQNIVTTIWASGV